MLRKEKPHAAFLPSSSFLYPFFLILLHLYTLHPSPFQPPGISSCTYLIVARPSSVFRYISILYFLLFVVIPLPSLSIPFALYVLTSFIPSIPSSLPVARPLPEGPRLFFFFSLTPLRFPFPPYSSHQVVPSLSLFLFFRSSLPSLAQLLPSGVAPNKVNKTN